MNEQQKKNLQHVSNIFKPTHFLMSAILTMVAISAVTPAFAQDRPSARFNFAPHYYRLEEPRVPRANYGSNVYFPERRQHTATSVRAGTVPSVNTLLGFNPSFIKQTKSDVAWQVTALPVIPVQQEAAPTNTVGRPAPPTPNPKESLRTRSVATKAVTAKLSSSGKRPALKVKRTNPSIQSNHQRQAKATKVLKYDNGIFDPSSTHPALYSTNSHATTSLSGKVLR